VLVSRSLARPHHEWIIPPAPQEDDASPFAFWSNGSCEAILWNEHAVYNSECNSFWSKDGDDDRTEREMVLRDVRIEVAKLVIAASLTQKAVRALDKQPKPPPA